MEKRLKELLVQMVNEKKIPRFVYRMRSINRYLFDSLINNEMWFSSAIDFNDPFDCGINLSSKNLTQVEVQNYFDLYLKKMVTTDSLDLVLDASNIQIDEFQKLINEVNKRVLRKKGVACFMDNRDNLLMWAHYANSHKGVCLKFDVLADLDFFSPSKKVSYRDDYPLYNYLQDKNKIAELLFIKSSDWAYEGEVRVVKDRPGNFPFKPESLIEVTFGVNTSNEDSKTLTKVLNQYYPHLTITKATKKEDSFGLAFVEV